MPRRLETVAEPWVYAKGSVINPYERMQTGFHNYGLTDSSLFVTLAMLVSEFATLLCR